MNNSIEPQVEVLMNTLPETLNPKEITWLLFRLFIDYKMPEEGVIECVAEALRLSTLWEKETKNAGFH